MTPPLPLTERILVRLGKPRLLWVALWALVPSATLLVAYPAARGLVGHELAWQQAVRARYGEIFLWTYVVVGLLLLTPIFLRLLVQAQALVNRFTGLSEDDRSQPFRGIGSKSVPLVLAVVVGGVYLLSDYRLYGPGFVLKMLPLIAVGNIPPMTGLWLAIVVFLGLHRLGRLPLTLESFTSDRSLGLRPFGRLALWAFVPLALFTAPFIFLNRDVSELLFNLILLLVAVSLFFLSLIGLRGQLLRAKARHVAWARGLVADALAPVLPGANPGPAPPGGAGEALRTQSAELLAAAEVERRAAAIQEWPYDEGTLRTFAAIATSVAGAMVARVILSRFGL